MSLSDAELDGTAAAISAVTPTKCQARTRLYRDGAMIAQGFPVAEISDYLSDEDCVIWLDLLDPDRDDLAVLGEEFGLHPLEIEDAEHEHERTKIDRYRSHLFLAAYAVSLDVTSGGLASSASSPRSSPAGRSSPCARTRGWTSAPS